MITGRPKKFATTLTESERTSLQQIAQSRSMPHGVVRRTQMILLSADGQTNTAIAARFQVTVPTVAHWRKRFKAHGLVGLYGEQRSGRPRTHDDDRVASLLNKVLQQRPKNATHWSIRSVAAETGVTKSTVHRFFKLFGLQPHRSKSFKLSNDPFFVEKVRDIVGLYLNPPDKALVLCVDEKSQIQALERTQPILPMGLGYVEGVTHDYYRHGTTTLFAALNVQSGQVITQCKARHRHQEFLSFLRHLDESVPAALDLHLIIDNYATHKHPTVQAWLDKHPRFHMHFTPTSASWLNMVERFFRDITTERLRRGVFTSVAELVAAIDAYVVHHNIHPKPFIWTKSARDILEKVIRANSRLSSKQNETLH